MHHAILGMYKNRHPSFTAFQGAMESKSLQLLNVREVTQSAQVIELRRGDPGFVQKFLYGFQRFPPLKHRNTKHYRT